jgi:hypothetical protein
MTGNEVQTGWDSLWFKPRGSGADTVKLRQALEIWCKPGRKQHVAKTVSNVKHAADRFLSSLNRIEGKLGELCLSAGLRLRKV